MKIWMEVKILKKAKYDGKWMELWWKDGQNDPDSFDDCVKAYMFWNAIDEAGLEEYVLNNGVKGLKIIQEKNDYYNLEIVKVER